MSVLLYFSISSANSAPRSEPKASGKIILNYHCHAETNYIEKMKTRDSSSTKFISLQVLFSHCVLILQQQQQQQKSLGS